MANSDKEWNEGFKAGLMEIHHLLNEALKDLNTSPEVRDWIAKFLESNKASYFNK